MAGGNLSPRQKMINLMYLVLMAMLALNVAKEVLDAFVVVNMGLLQQKESLNTKSVSVYNQLEAAALVDPVKVTPIKEDAKKIGEKSKELVDFIETMKIELIKNVEGVDDAVAKERAEKPSLVDKKDDYDKPTHYFGTNEPPGTNGKANELKKKLDDFRSFALGFVKKDADKKRLGDLGIDTQDPPSSDEAARTWELKYFYHLPLSAALTELTKWQNIVKGAEVDMLNYFFEQTSAGTFKFDRVDARVIPKSNYVLSGSKFEADIFLAASSSTQKPKIVVGSAVDTVSYNVVGGVDMPNDQIINGVGKYSVPASGVGEKTLAGKIVIKDPTGNERSYPFSTTYNVAPPSATIAPTKMNVFYAGLDNPVSVSVPGVAPANITVNCSGCQISGSAGNYMVKASNPGNATISVSAKMPDGTTANMGSQPFRVKPVPTPVIEWAGKRSNEKVSASAAAASPLIPKMENFDFEVFSTIRSFTIAFTLNGNYFNKQCNGNTIPGDIQSKIKTLPKGTKVYFDDIKIMVPGSSTARTSNASFTIQ